ncbi:hypothetical protein BU24DRAFT_116353 [Aaosphaeria arxii CBS 175.79]|uniref:Uncharacterized protein n=1 Tax=Aaosphaeria arxii CBS 175.79 TaxID=1450172 RepID=A0A6A5Y171_9PLEO|nr:uncharacterized protein BU24DRAFT_116353 [Aaosphaeria arxii CBS 175.79]KAF2019305.1 hypothetical protein BU24DRAFT_116353 [Aaosphaeria arxii CBS 175.79]
MLVTEPYNTHILFSTPGTLTRLLPLDRVRACNNDPPMRSWTAAGCWPWRGLATGLSLFALVAIVSGLCPFKSSYPPGHPRFPSLHRIKQGFVTHSFLVVRLHSFSFTAYIPSVSPTAQAHSFLCYIVVNRSII